MKAKSAVICECYCSSGKRVLGGGYRLLGKNWDDLKVEASRPYTLSGGDIWQVKVTNPTRSDKRVWVHSVCAYTS